MGKFINTHNLVRICSVDNQIEIVHIGYNDFNFVKPIKHFWTDNRTTLHFVISGKGKLFFNGKEYNLKKGDLFLLPGGSERMYYPDEDDKWEYVWFGLKGNSYNTLCDELKFSLDNPVKTNNDYEQLFEVYSELFNKMSGGSDNGYLPLSALYKIMHILTTDSYSGLEGAKRILDEKFSQKDFSIENLCKNVGMSHSELCRQFKNKWNISPNEYLTEKRMEYALILLKETTLSVCETAYSCGYSDALHFMKMFKKRHNCTCLEYRNSK